MEWWATLYQERTYKRKGHKLFGANFHLHFPNQMHIFFDQFSVVRWEERTEARNCNSFDHEHSFFTPFLCTILNILAEICSPEKYSMKDEQGPYTSWQQHVTGCNKSNCFVITSSQCFVNLPTTVLRTVILASTVCRKCTNHLGFVVSRAAILSIGWVQCTSGGNSASWLFKSSGAVSSTDPCDARPLRSGEPGLSDVISRNKIRISQITDTPTY